jgi:hypothetical protein
MFLVQHLVNRIIPPPKAGRLFVWSLLFAGIVLPQVTLAVTFTQFVVFFVGDIVNKVIVVIVGLATVYFLLGSTKYILHAGDAAQREEGRNMMIYGIIAIFVMVSVWGLVNLLSNTFRLDNSTIPRAEDFVR